MSFFVTINLVLWSFWVSLGILATIALGSYYKVWGFGGFPFLVFVAFNFGLAYFWNKARKHFREEAFDDRLTSQRMEEATRSLIADFKKGGGE